jgi:hypothetical protein
MAITNYSELQTAISDWLARSSLTAAQVSQFISLAESLFKRAPLPRTSPNMGGVRGAKTQVSGALTAGTNSLSLPADFAELDSFSLTAEPVSVLRFVSPEQVRRYRRAASGKPAYFSIADVIEFDVTPDSAYAYQMTYWPTISALSVSNTTNWLLTKYPDVYLAGSMMWANRYLMESEEAATWAAQYKEAAAMASQEYFRSRQSQGPLSIVLEQKPYE